MKRALLLVSLALLAGCAASVPPPGWQQGGAALWVPRAAWRSGALSIDLMQDGHVMMNGASSFLIDPAGRVIDADGQPVALLLPDGRLVGTKGEALGVVGPVTAAPAGSRYAWLGILPSGQVVRYDDEGQSAGGGTWVGCGGYAASLQACMLVTYLVATRFPPPQPPSTFPNSPYNSPYGSPYSPWGTMTPGIGFGASPW
jgi:hypothetical protein